MTFGGTIRVGLWRRLVPWHEASTSARRVSSAAAPSLAREALVELERVASYRSISAALGPLAPLTHNPRSLFEALRDALRDGHLLLEEELPPAYSPPKVESLPPPPPKERPPPKDTDETWFEARLVDELGEPIEAVELEYDADGKHSRVTDGAGTTRLDPAEASFGHVRVLDRETLTTTLRERWNEVREGDWLERQADHTIFSLRRAEELRASILSEVPHSLVVQPWCIRGRLIGMFFDTNKCFLLPTAMAGIRKMVQLYEDHPDSTILIVGHTDTSGDATINDPLSLERADAVAAFLRDDVDAWLGFYEPSTSYEKRWGHVEDHHMLSTLVALPSASPPQPHEPPVYWYQRTRGLEVDGWIGTNTRRQLVTDYMALDGTTLPSGTPVTTHGCGENFATPEAEGGTNPGTKQLSRRVELYFFDRELGVQPPPPGTNSGPDSVEYPEWVRRATETYDFDTSALRRIVLGIDAHEIQELESTYLVVTSEAGREYLRRPAVSFDRSHGHHTYFDVDPNTIPDRVSAYWETDDAAYPILEGCSLRSLLGHLDDDDTLVAMRESLNTKDP